MKLSRLLVTALLGSGLATSALGLDLLGAYRLALSNDANYLAAQSAAEAAREAVPQAISGLLPNIGYTAGRSKNTTESTTPSISGANTTTRDYEARNWSLSLRQPLLRVDRVIQLGQAESQVASAEATLEKETQTLALRVSSAYFDVLLAFEQLKSVQAQIKAYAAQLVNAERSLIGGEGTRTDIDEARARHLLAQAQEIDIKSVIDQRERTLASIIGQRVAAAALATLDEGRLVTEVAAPKDFEAWLTQAEETNPELRALRHNFEAAQADVNIARAQHLPTIDLVVSKSYSQSDSNQTIGSTYRTDSLGLQLNMPIFSGGRVTSATRQAVAEQERIRQQMEAARRQLGVEVAKQYDAYFRGALKVKAYEEARNAQRQLLVSTRKGLQAGTRNTIDVLNAEQQLATSEVELARTRVEFSLASLKLSAAAGELEEKDILRLNSWLELR